jgi:hypothetical protein
MVENGAAPNKTRGSHRLPAKIHGLGTRVQHTQDPKPRLLSTRGCGHVESVAEALAQLCYGAAEGAFEAAEERAIGRDAGAG